MPFDFDPFYATYPVVIKKMPPTFDSHDFIREWSHDNQKPYIKALSAQTAKRDNDLFMIVHGKLAKGLSQHPKLVQKTGDVASTDIFGGQTPCMSWRKII